MTYYPPTWQFVLWAVNALFFLLVAIVGFWFKTFLDEIKADLREIKEELKRGALNFNSNNLKIQDLSERVTKLEAGHEILKDEHNRCSVCHKIIKT